MTYKLDLHYLIFKVRGTEYLEYIRDLKKLDFEVLLMHENETLYFSKFKDYGIDFLRFLKETLRYNLPEIIDKRRMNIKIEQSLLKWVFKR